MQSIEGSVHTSMDSKTAGDNSVSHLELSTGLCFKGDTDYEIVYIILKE